MVRQLSNIIDGELFLLSICKIDPVLWNRIPYTDFDFYVDRLYKITKEMAKASAPSASSTGVNNPLANQLKDLFS